MDKENKQLTPSIFYTMISVTTFFLDLRDKVLCFFDKSCGMPYTYTIYIFTNMTETYTGSSKGKRMTKSEWKRLLKQLANSYKNSDVIKKKLSQQKEKEASNAESELENDLNALYS